MTQLNPQAPTVLAIGTTPIPEMTTPLAGPERVV